MLPLQKAWVRSLVRELRSCMLHGPAKNFKISKMEGLSQKVLQVFPCCENVTFKAGQQGDCQGITWRFTTGAGTDQKESHNACPFQASLPGPPLLQTPFIPNAHGRMSGYILPGSFPGDSVVKNLPANPGDSSLIPGLGRSPEKETAAHSSTLAWRIPWTEEPGRLLSMGSQKNQTWLSACTHTHTHTHGHREQSSWQRGGRMGEGWIRSLGWGDANYYI